MKNIINNIKENIKQKALAKSKAPHKANACGDALQVQNKNIFHKLYNILLKLLNQNLVPGFFAFFIWIMIDIIRYIIKRIKRVESIHIYGIYGYFGLWGQGKTVSMTNDLLNLRRKYKDKIYIFTNYGFKLEDKPFDDWHMLLDEYNKPVVFAWDEVQNEFNSRNFKSFPTELLTILTQNRKGNGKRVLYTAQRWGRVDKVFRELTYLCYECKTHFGRWTTLKGYHWEDYEDLTSSSDLNHRIKIKSRNVKSFIQTDYLRSLYDSFQMLQTAKSKEYLDRIEQKKLIE